jgi:hypothetical protein
MFTVRQRCGRFFSALRRSYIPGDSVNRHDIAPEFSHLADLKPATLALPLVGRM